jgi:hypothetical protein
VSGTAGIPAVHGGEEVKVLQTSLDPEPVGRLDEVKRAQLDQALRYALDIRY